MERHHLDVLSLILGTVFVAIDLVGLTDAVTISVADLRWLGPLAIVATGVLLVVTAGNGRRRDAGAEDAAVDREALADPDLDVGYETQELRRDG